MEETINEPAKTISIKKDADIIVVGAGPAGISAAINAAREGMRTVLIEQSGSVGGVATSGLMSHWAGLVQGGLFEEIIDRSIDCYKDDGSMLGHPLSIHPEKLKSVLFEMLDEAGVYLQLYTMFVDVIKSEENDNNSVYAIITESKSGREAFTGKIFIDSTGDGDLAAKSGVPFKKGRDKDGKMQPMTLMFNVGGVDLKRAVLPGSFETNPQIPKGYIQDLGKEHLPHPAGHVLLYGSTLPSIVSVNMTNAVDVDGTKAEDLTRAHKICQSQVYPIVDFLREYVPGFEKCYLIISAPMVGVRETRRFEGLYTLTAKDILEARVFDDWAVPSAYFNFDVHNIEGSGLDETGAQNHFKQRKPYTIPYRCFVPKTVQNLYLSGRNISGTHLAHSNYRVMTICAKMGEVIGIAAALCVKNEVNPCKLDVRMLQDILTAREMRPL